MIRKRTVVFATIGLTVLLNLSSVEVWAQCSRGGSSRGGGGAPTGSTIALNSSLPYTSNALSMNYPSSIGLMAQQYQQRPAQIQNQGYAMGYQNADRQRLAMVARQAQAQPYRLARAEAKRAARAERIAAQIARRDAGSISRSSDFYAFTSTTAKP